jgi:SAM-dependent methyltransferase
VSFEVFEHIFSPHQVLAELHRVLRPGGTILISIPFVFREHEKPFDFARYTSFGIRHLLIECGFSIQQIEKTTTERGVLAHVLIGYLERVLGGRRLLGTIVLTPLMFLLNWWGSRRSKHPLLAEDDMFLNVVVLGSRA